MLGRVDTVGQNQFGKSEETVESGVTTAGYGQGC